MMRNRLIAALLLLAAPGGVAHAAETRIELLPGSSAVSIRAWKLGLFPLDGEFRRFRGWLTYDPANRDNCRVELHVDVASLTMASSMLQASTLGPDFLDAARYPSLAFRGACDGKALDGVLDMHGVTRPFALSLDWQPLMVSAVGRLQRSDWDMTALPVVVGPTVRIAVTAHLAAPRHAGP